MWTSSKQKHKRRCCRCCLSFSMAGNVDSRSKFGKNAFEEGRDVA